MKDETTLPQENCLLIGMETEQRNCWLELTGEFEKLSIPQEQKEKLIELALRYGETLTAYTSESIREKISDFISSFD